MKKFFILFMIISATCQASVYVIYNESSKEIFTISEKDDTVLSAGQVLEVIPGNIEGLGLNDNPTNYKYINHKFVLNSKKISDLELARLAIKYNDARFKASLLADTQISSFGFTPFYPAISDCLTYQNWSALNSIFSMMVQQQAATQEQIDYFKQKILQEEGVTL